MLKNLAEFIQTYPLATGQDLDCLVITEDIARALDHEIAESTSPVQAKQALIAPDGQELTTAPQMMAGTIAGKRIVVLIGREGGQPLPGRLWMVERKPERTDGAH